MVVSMIGQSSLPIEKRDSLWYVWTDNKKNDTTRANALFEIIKQGYIMEYTDSAFHFIHLLEEFSTKKSLPKHLGNALHLKGVANYLKGNYVVAKIEYNKSLLIKKDINDLKGISTTLSNLALIHKNQGNYDSALSILNESIAIDKQLNDEQNIALVLNSMGNIYRNKGDYEKALKHYNQALKIYQKLNNEESITTTLTNMAVVYYEQGDFSTAIKLQTKGLQVAEKNGNQRNMANAHNSIGLIYYDYGDHNKAYYHYQKSLQIARKLKDPRYISKPLNNLGLYYLDVQQYDSALISFNESLQIDESMGDDMGIAINFNNIGLIYQYTGQLDKAIEYFTNSIQIKEKLGDLASASSSYSNLGMVYFTQQKYNLAINYLRKSYQNAQESQSIIQIKESAMHLWIAYKKVNKYKESLEAYEVYISTRDSLISEENQKAIIHQEFKYNYDKKVATDSIENVKKAEIHKIEIAKQKAEKTALRNQQYLLFGGLGIAFLFGLFMYNRFKVTQRQRDIIEQQKNEVVIQKNIADEQRHLVEEKNKEITDSINYAKRIQEAILPSRYSLVENLKNGFILFKPKDVVSGDFYWLEKYQEAVYFAAADCTGHGVPGAMVSVVCSNALSKGLLEEGISDTGQLLDRTRELVIERFAKSGEHVKDGMDISLCKLQGNVLSWSGANNPLWIIRKSSNESAELLEIKPDKQPIGNYAEPKPFTTHHFELNPGDALYIFTDGFADQFGGPKGKKYMYKPFKELLINIHDKSMDEQKLILEKHFEDWKGGHEQVDDVCIIGVRI
jgi:tetratricopeptide (TPR) repeat protein